MVDTRDLKSLGQKCPCGFDSRPRHKAKEYASEDEILQNILRIKKFALYLQSDFAEIAQLVERDLAKVEVAGPNPVFRSKQYRDAALRCGIFVWEALPLKTCFYKVGLPKQKPLRSSAAAILL